MGYLIESFLQKKEVIIDAANLALVDTVPAQIIKSSELTDYTIVAANMACTNKASGDVNGFGHFYLQCGYVAGSEKVAVYDENVGIVNRAFKSYFIINMIHPPNQFGAIYNYQQDLTLSAQFAPTVNITDMIVTVYYFKNF